MTYNPVLLKSLNIPGVYQWYLHLAPIHRTSFFAAFRLVSVRLSHKGPYYFLAVANIVDVLLLVGHAAIFGLDIGIANALADLDLQTGDQYIDLRQAKLLSCVLHGFVLRFTKHDKTNLLILGRLFEVGLRNLTSVAYIFCQTGIWDAPPPRECHPYRSIHETDVDNNGSRTPIEQPYGLGTSQNVHTGKWSKGGISPLYWLSSELHSSIVSKIAFNKRCSSLSSFHSDLDPRHRHAKLSIPINCDLFVTPFAEAATACIGKVTICFVQTGGGRDNMPARGTRPFGRKHVPC